MWGRYEKHAEYPRNCDNSFWVPGAWANVYQDLRDLLFESAKWDVPQHWTALLRRKKEHGAPRAQH